MMKIDKKWMLIMSVMLACASMSYAKAESDEDKGLLGGFLGSLGPVGAACFANKSCRAEALAAIKKINLKEYAKNVLSKIKTKGMEVVMKSVAGGLEKMPIEEVARFAVTNDYAIPGFSKADLERIARGDTKGLTQEKLDDLTQKLSDKIQGQVEGLIDLAERKVTTMANKAVEKVADLAGVEVDTLRSVAEAAVVSPTDLKATVKRVGHVLESEIAKKMGVARAQNIPITLTDDLFEDIGDDWDPDGDEGDFASSAVDKLSAQEKFYHENAVLYEKGGRKGSKDVLKEYKDRWKAKQVADKRPTDAAAFLDHMKEILPDNVSIIEKNFSASKLESMSVDSLLGSKFGRQTMAEREFRSGINELYEGIE